MRKIIFTGNNGMSVSRVAAATAMTAAHQGQRTLLMSVGPSHGVDSLLNVAAGNAPQPTVPNLDVWVFDVLTHIGAFWDQTRSRMPSSLNVAISGDELPLIPGLDLFLGLDRLQRPPATSYDLVVVDAGPHETLLRGLAAPDSFRWGLRLLFGIDRDPGRSMASVGRSLVPTTLLPIDWVDRVQDARVELEHLRDSLVATRHTTARYVLQPEAATLATALVAVPALQMHSLAVDAVVVGPLLPGDITDDRLTALAAQQQEVVGAAQQAWQGRPLLSWSLEQSVTGTDDLAKLGATLYDRHAPQDMYGATAPIEQSNGSAPFVSISLPGLPREMLALTLSGDELIVRAGPYRRHILLPEALRGKSNIRANREEDRLVVRLR